MDVVNFKIKNPQKNPDQIDNFVDLRARGEGDVVFQKFVLKGNSNF